MSSALIIYPAALSAYPCVMSTIYDTRLVNARALIASVGGPTRAAEVLGISPSQLSQSTGRNPTRHIGEASARLFERAFDKERGWLDRPHQAAEEVKPYLDKEKYAYIPRYRVVAAAGAPRNSEHEEIDGTHAYRRDWLDRHGLVPAACVVIEVTGHSMHPTISDGDVVLVNTADRTLRNGEVYAFRHDDGPRLKRLFKQLDGRIRVASDNQDKIAFPDEWLTPDMDVGMIGKVVHRAGAV